MTIRVIPRLDIKGPNLVKGVHLEGLRVLGRPEYFARHYYEHGADELLYMDVVASLYGRNSLLDAIERTSRAIFIPLTVGGGLRRVEDVRDVLRAGADKVAINTAAIARPEFVHEIARRFGSSTVVVSIEALAVREGEWHAFTDNGREETGIDALEWAERAAELGAGEIMVTSIDREGTGKGFDLELTRRIADRVDIPVIACGGAGNAQHVVDVVRDAGASAVGAASILHYECSEELAQEHPGDEGNTEFLRNRTPVNRLQPTSLPAVKRAMLDAGLAVRPFRVEVPA